MYSMWKDKNIEFVYARSFMNANPWLIHFFRKLRLAGIKAVTEIPTYPYDHELDSFSFGVRFGLKIDQLFRKQLCREMSAIVTFSDATEIFGQRTINISNGVDFDSIPLNNPQPVNTNTSIHLIGVAAVHLWHGFDRIMTGMGEYKGNRDVFFHVVGGVDPNRITSSFVPIIKKYGLQNRIIFHVDHFGISRSASYNQI